MAKPKLYGNRWKIADSAAIGHGGQSTVFCVEDTQGEHQGRYALKRVLNPQRHERFRAEVEAIKRLTHPNIVRLIDHSALDEAATSDKQYLVMPIAEGGDLGGKDRYSLYEGALDAILIVTKQLTSALEAAHDAGIIHRDVKPENILFTGNGHEVLLADFGICLIEGTTRLTHADEVVGPRVFMAPELEDGGNLVVTPAADVYSLGKVVYFMLTGGKVVPRERLDEEQYAKVFEKGERYKLLQHLLRRMICALPNRLKTMREVSSEIDRIVEWETQAQVLSLSPESAQRLSRLKSRNYERKVVASENATAREQEQNVREIVNSGVSDWLTAELTMLAEHSTSDDLPMTVQDVSAEPSLKLRAGNSNDMFVSHISIELVVCDVNPVRRHGLRIHLLERRQVIVSVGDQPQRQPTKDLQFALIPMYRQTRPTPKGESLGLHGYFKQEQFTKIFHPRARVTTTSPRVSASFNPGVSQILEFRASDWPQNLDLMKSFLSQTVDSFTLFLEDGASHIDN
ncbi:serine/threonine-protein kinase [Burkholderia cepacia]|uniref:serine/threonine-protein kinase n=1 Tax=Burkholderia cepacia TaxID=292 RepID=UPI0009BF77E0|nr:serine/threonine-protein kinase [Burkholderia cepacia]